MGLEIGQSSVFKDEVKDLANWREMSNTATLSVLHNVLY